LFGGDSRLLNDLATEVGVRVAVGNTVNRVLVAEDNLLSADAAVELCLKSASLVTTGGKNSIDESSSLPTVAFVLSTSKSGGIKGSFGVSVVFASGVTRRRVEDNAATALVSWFDETSWLRILTRMSAQRYVQISPLRFLSPVDTVVRSKTNEVTSTIKGAFPADAMLVKSLKSQFDFPALKSYIAKSGLIFTVDALGSRLATRSLRMILSELGVDVDNALLNPFADENSQDFNGLVPDGIPSRDSDSATLFNLPDTHSFSLADLQSIQSSIEEEEEEEEEDESVNGTFVNDSKGSRDESISVDDFSDCPDLGFVFNSDASQCSVLMPGVELSSVESANLLSAQLSLPNPPTSAPSVQYEGLRAMLGWLTLLASRPNESILKKHFSRYKIIISLLLYIFQIIIIMLYRYGRRITMKIDVDISLQAAVTILTKTQELQRSLTAAAVTLPVILADIDIDNNNNNSTNSLSNVDTTQEENAQCLDDVTDYGLADISVISDFLLTSHSTVSNASTSNSSMTNNVSVNDGSVTMTQRQETSLNHQLIRNISGSRINMTFENYSPFVVTGTLQPANVAVQLISSHHQEAADCSNALVNQLLELLNQTTSMSSELLSTKALTLSIMTSADIAPEIYEADKSSSGAPSVSKQMTSLTKAMLKVLVKSMMVAGSEKELLPSQILPENIKIHLFATDLSSKLDL